MPQEDELFAHQDLPDAVKRMVQLAEAMPKAVPVLVAAVAAVGVVAAAAVEAVAQA